LAEPFEDVVYGPIDIDLREICKKLEIKYYVISLCNKICQIERWNVACKMLTCSSKNLFVHKIYLSIDILLRAYFKFNST
jgi:hypothetical protein